MVKEYSYNIGEEVNGLKIVNQQANILLQAIDSIGSGHNGIFAFLENTHFLFNRESHRV